MQVQELEKLYKTHHNYVFCIVLSIIKDRDTAKDITQDIFIKIDRLMRDSNASDISSSFMFICSRNETLNYIKKENFRKGIDSECISKTNYNSVSDIMAYRDLINIARLLLTRRQRIIFYLNIIKDKSTTNIAKELSICNALVKREVKTAKEIIAKYLSGKKDVSNIIVRFGNWNSTTYIHKDKYFIKKTNN